MTRLRRAKPSEEPADWAHSPERVLVNYFARDSVWKRRRVAELRLYFAETYGPHIPFTESGLRHAAVFAGQLGEFLDGPARIDKFLENETEFDAPARARLKQAALSGPIRSYGAAELGQILGLTWEIRTRLKITTFDAVDAPSDDARKAMHLAQDAAHKRAKRAAECSLPKPASMRHRKSQELARRRLLAIHDAVGEGMSVSDLSEIFLSTKNGPFYGVSADSMPRVVRRAIATDPSLSTELRPMPGRPDLKPQMWVARKAPPPSMEKTMVSDTKRPTNEAEYREHVAARLAEFTPATAKNELREWFNSPDETALRAECGITDRKEYLVMANETRNRLMAAEWSTNER